MPLMPKRAEPKYCCRCKLVRVRRICDCGGMRYANNPYGITSRMWARWSEHARAVFAEVIRPDQSDMKHPNAPRLSAKEWHTLRHNFAWIAAEAVDGFRVKVKEADK